MEQTIQAMVTGISNSTLSAAIINIHPPMFSGGSSEDIHEWMDRFEQATFALPDEQKALLLGRAFTKAARPWYSDELRPKLQVLSWKEARNMILEHFSSQAKEDKFYEKLNSLKYDKDRHGCTLLFVDEYAYLYKRAYPSAQPAEIVRAAINNLPAAIRGKFNLIADIRQLKTIDDLKDIAKRYDQEDSDTTTSNAQPLDMEKFKQIMSGVVSELVEKQAERTNEVLAAFMKCPQQTDDRYGRRRNRNDRQAYQNYQNNRASYSGNYQRQDNQRQGQYTANNYENIQGNNSQPPRAPSPYPANRNNQFRKSNRGPPSPCYYCNGDHWNSECPVNQQQGLNGQGC